MGRKLRPQLSLEGDNKLRVDKQLELACKAADTYIVVRASVAAFVRLALEGMKCEIP